MIKLMKSDINTYESALEFDKNVDFVSIMYTYGPVSNMVRKIDGYDRTRF